MDRKKLIFGVAGLGAIGAGAWVLMQKSDSPRSDVADMFTFDSTKDGFIAQMQAAMPDGLSLAAQQSLIAEAAYETNWGSTSGFTCGNNAYNITSSTPTGCNGGDTEYDAAGNVTKITQQWRVYASLTDSINDFMKVLGQTRFGGALSDLMAGGTSFVEMIGNATPKYYTLPVQQYVAGFMDSLSYVQGSMGAQGQQQVAGYSFGYVRGRGLAVYG